MAKKDKRKYVMYGISFNTKKDVKKQVKRDIRDIFSEDNRKSKYVHLT